MKLDHERIESLRLYHFIAWLASLKPPMLDMDTKMKFLDLCAIYIGEYGEGQ